MREARGNLWDFWEAGHYIAVTTNGVVKADGKLVMGAGVAKQARDRMQGVRDYGIPSIDTYLGEKVKKYGNRVFLYDGSPDDPSDSDYRCFSFPTKHHWRDPSNLDLIVESWCSLIQHACSMDIEVYLPQPGCGLGGLNWKTEVRPRLLEYDDDRVIVVTF
jgi:hypothetical protein